MENRNMTKEEISQRVARFDQLQPMSTSKDMADVPQEAMDVIFARKLMPVILEKTKNPFGDSAAIFGAAGTTMNVSVCPPDKGHACTPTMRRMRPLWFSMARLSFLLEKKDKKL